MAITYNYTYNVHRNIEYLLSVDVTKIRLRSINAFRIIIVYTLNFTLRVKKCNFFEKKKVIDHPFISESSV